MDAHAPVERSQLIRGATPREVYDVVIDFEQYPRLFPEIKKVRVIERTPAHARVEFRADNLLPVRYVLDLVLDPSAWTVDWSYVEGEVITDSTGRWRFAVEADGVRVDYRASAKVKAPLPSFILRRITDALVSASLPSMFASVEQEVRRRQSSVAPSTP